MVGVAFVKKRLEVEDASFGKEGTNAVDAAALAVEGDEFQLGGDGFHGSTKS